MLIDIIEKIEQQLKKELPGLEAQKKMAPSIRTPFNYNPNPEGAKKGGVLLLLYYNNNELYIPLIERADDGGVHSGQIAFPGGKSETEDKTLFETAKRETFEEIGIEQNKLRVLGSLTELFIPVSNYSVFPVVGFLDSKPEFILNKNEVKKIIEVPLSALYNNFYSENIILNKIDVERPFFKINNYKIWGATAMILSEFLEVVKSI